MLIYLVLPFAVWLFSTNKLHGLYFPLTVIFVAQICSFYNSFQYDLSPNRSYRSPHSGGHPGGISIFWIGKIFSFTVCYCCGVALAFFMMIIDEKNKKFVLLKWQYFGLVALSCFALASVVMWPYNDVKDAPEIRWSASSNSWYSALCKTAWVKLTCSVSTFWTFCFSQFLLL